MPYLGPVIKILIRRGCCCCRRKDYKSRTHMNAEFSMERRYATILTTCFICFNYGFAIPMLFIVASCVLLAQYIIDKLLVTYYYKERVEHNDYLNRWTLKVLKYGIVSFLFFAAFAMHSNYCALNNIEQTIDYMNQFCVCTGWWKEPITLATCSLFCFIFFVAYDLWTIRTSKKSVAEEIRTLAQEEDKSYFSRLSNIDRKRWICHEHFCRKNYGIQTISD